MSISIPATVITTFLSLNLFLVNKLTSGESYAHTLVNISVRNINTIESAYFMKELGPLIRYILNNHLQVLQSKQLLVGLGLRVVLQSKSSFFHRIGFKGFRGKVYNKNYTKGYLISPVHTSSSHRLGCWLPH